MKKILLTLIFLSSLTGTNFVSAAATTTPTNYVSNYSGNYVPTTTPTSNPATNAGVTTPDPISTATDTVIPSVTTGVMEKAPGSYKLLEPLPCIPGTASDKNCVNGVTTDMPIDDYLGYIYKFAIAIAAFLAVIMIIWGGFQYMTVESFTGKSSAKKTIQDAAWGLFMVLASYIILKTIDPRLVAVDTNIPRIVIDTKEIIATRSKMDADLSAMATEAINKSAEISKTIDSKQVRIDELTQKYLDGTITDTEDIELSQLEQDVSDLGVDQSKVIANGTIAIQAPLAINPTNIVTQKDAIDKINANYDVAINNLDANKQADQVQELKKQKTAIDNAIFSKGLINGNVMDMNHTTYSETDRVNAKVSLGNQLVSAKKELADLDKNYTDPDFKKTYAAILQNNIDIATKALGITPKK